MKFNKHKHRNQTNRNMIVIAVSFLATAMAGALIFQTYVSKIENIKYKKVRVEIESSIPSDSLKYTFEISNDTAFSKPLLQGKEVLSIPVAGNAKKFVSFTLSNKTYSDSLLIQDNIGYVFIVVNADSVRLSL